MAPRKGWRSGTLSPITPLIAITTDFDGEKQSLRPEYAAAVMRAGGVPVLLPLEIELVNAFVERFAGFVLTGGDDPIMEHWGVPTHPRAKRIHPRRQAFELALLDALREQPEKPVLGICLGMQLMTLHSAGGSALDQHLPDTDPGKAERHWGKKPHGVTGDLGEGVVLSHHRQAIVHPGSGPFEVCAMSDDDVIEAVRDASRAFYLGVQWHPERTGDERLGAGIFERFVDAARRAPLIPS